MTLEKAIYKVILGEEVITKTTFYRVYFKNGDYFKKKDFNKAMKLAKELYIQFPDSLKVIREKQSLKETKNEYHKIILDIHHVLNLAESYVLASRHYKTPKDVLTFIKSQFKKHHPDKGGDARVFMQYLETYKILK